MSSVVSVCATHQQQRPRSHSCHLPYSCSFKRSSSRAVLGSSSVFSVVSVCDILKLRFIQVYRLAIFPWCQPQLLQFNQTVESSHYRKGCLNSSNTKYRISLGVYMVYVFYSSIPLNTPHYTEKLLKKLVVSPKSLIFAKRTGKFGVNSVNINKNKLL